MRGLEAAVEAVAEELRGSGARPAVDRLVRGLSGRRETPRLRLRLDQVDAGYASLTGPVDEAMHPAARTQGVVLHPIYTGRTMAGLIAAVRDGAVRPGRRTVFVHAGGLPGLFGQPEALEHVGGSIC